MSEPEEGKGKVKCHDFAGLVSVCVGDYVMVKTSREIVRGTLKEIGEFGYLLEDDNGFEYAVRYKYIMFIKVLERGQNHAGDTAH